MIWKYCSKCQLWYQVADTVKECLACDTWLVLEEFNPHEPYINDSVKFCPECEKPNQFGELCVECRRYEQETFV